MYRFVAASFLFLLLDSTMAAEPAQSSSFPWNEVPDVKVAEIREDLLARAQTLLEDLPSYGRCTGSVAACLRKDAPHSTAGRLARDVLLLLARDAKREEIAKWVKTRARMAHPEEIRTFELNKLVPLGNKDAKITVVEYSDFQCPFCARLAPLLEKVVQESDGKARLFFKQFPIKSHPRALAASRACVASQKFNKFWEYCGKLFRYQQSLSEENFLGLAAECGIDTEAFKSEMEREEVVSRIADEKLEGLKHRITGTPTLFINGKPVLLEPTADLIRDRIEEELDILLGRD